MTSFPQLDATDKAILSRIKGRATPQEIAGHAAAYFGHTLAKITAPGRDPAIVRLRQRIAFIAHHAGYSYPRIGRALDRHHSTIIHAVRQEAKRRTEA